uniref:Uncharacterized protein n=1 Tax=Aegilops tauschii subsp. strangulata TaxID=200361 RepID=A0A453ML68_AEGTS
MALQQWRERLLLPPVSKGPLHCQREVQDCLPLPASKELDERYVVHVSASSLFNFLGHLFTFVCVHSYSLSDLVCFSLLYWSKKARDLIGHRFA